jgi:ribonucleoside-diphosphate reductase beta chain
MGASGEKILDTKNLVTKGEKKIFFGLNYSGFQRYDNPKYPFAVSMEEKQRNAFWNPKEISMTNDALKFFEMPEFIQEVMIRIWLFQTLMDSAQNSGLEEILASLCTNPEFEALFKTQGYFELIHSLSYSHILRGIFSDASVIFDRIADYPEIQKRVNKEIDLYNRVKNIGNNFDEIIEAKTRINNEVQAYIDDNNITDKMELKRIYDILEITNKNLQLEINDKLSEEDRNKLILELLVGILALEGVKFYVSFLMTYVINNNYNNKIQGATRIIKLINFDEDLHTSIISGTIQILKKNKIEGFSELINSDWFNNMAVKTFKDVLVDELEFADYLLSFGDIPTLTKGVIEAFMKYYVDERLNSIGINKIYNQEKTDVVQFFESYKDMDNSNIAQQESDMAVYSIGIMKNDIPDGVLKLFKRAKGF